MRKKALVLIIGLGVFGLVGWRIGWLKVDQTEPPLNGKEEIVAEEHAGVNLVIDFGDGEVLAKDGLKVEGLSVYEVLERVVAGQDISLESQQYDFGVLVKAIGGRENTAERAWLYFVNGEAGQVAADRQILMEGDEVEWRYMKPVAGD